MHIEMNANSNEQSGRIQFVCDDAAEEKLQTCTYYVCSAPAVAIK